MTYNLDQLKEMIPIYLNGRLSEKDRIAFNDGLKRFPELEKELAEFSDIQESYTEVENDIPLDSDALFARIQDNIQAEEKQAPAFQIKKWFQHLIQRLSAWYHTPALSWSVAGLQFAALLFVIALIPRDNHYETYSSSSGQKDGILINAVFKPGAKEMEIRTLLQQIGASIVDGPTASGLYVLEVDASANVDAIIQKLDESEIVRLVEKSLSSLGRYPSVLAMRQPRGHTFIVSFNWFKRIETFS